MTWEPRPLPIVTPETAPFWAGAADGEFLLNECTVCGLTYYYPRKLCPECLSDDVEWVQANGTGEVYSYSVVNEISGWPESDLPLVNAYVELDEGPRVFTNIVGCDPKNVAIGTPVEVSFESTNEPDIAIPVFTPIDG